MNRHTAPGPEGTPSRLGSELTRISQSLPADVAQALLPAVSRLVSTRVRGRGTVPKSSVGRSADAAGMSACATSPRSNTGEKSGLTNPGHDRKGVVYG
jgi:hypothetical protein